MFTYNTNINLNGNAISISDSEYYENDLENILDKVDYAIEIAQFILKENPYTLINIPEKEFKLAIVNYLYDCKRWDKLPDNIKMKIQKHFEENGIEREFPERIRWQNFTCGKVYQEWYYEMEDAEEVYQTLLNRETDQYTYFWNEESFWDYVYYSDIDFQPKKEDELNPRDKAILKELRENGACVVFNYHCTKPTEIPDWISEKEPVLKKIDALEDCFDDTRIEVVI